METMKLETVTPESRPSLVWQLVEKLDEQREYPRVPVCIPVQVTNFRGDQVGLDAINLSPDGLQLRCDVNAARIIHANGGLVQPGRDPLLETRLHLPFVGGEQVLSLAAELLYLTTVDAEPRVVLGLRFVNPDSGAERAISAFLGEQMSDGTQTLS